MAFNKSKGNVAMQIYEICRKRKDSRLLEKTMYSHPNSID